MPTATASVCWITTSSPALPSHRFGTFTSGARVLQVLLTKGPTCLAERLLCDGLSPQQTAQAVAQFTALVADITEAAYKSRNVESAFEVGAAPAPVLPLFDGIDIHALLKKATWPERAEANAIIEDECTTIVTAFSD